jgi:hypothetical protein
MPFPRLDTVVGVNVPVEVGVVVSVGVIIGVDVALTWSTELGEVGIDCLALQPANHRPHRVMVEREKSINPFFSGRIKKIVFLGN